MENTMTNEVMEMVEDVDVIEVAEQYVPKFDFIGFAKGCGKVGVALCAGYGVYKLVTDVIIPAAQNSKKSENETVDYDTCDDYAESIDDSDVEDVEE